MAARGMVAASMVGVLESISPPRSEHNANWLQTLKASLFWDVKSCVRPGDCVLGVAAVRGSYLMEGSNPNAGFELGDVGADLVDDAGDIVSLVALPSGEGRHLPILGIAAADDSSDAQLIIIGLGNRRLHDEDLKVWQLLTNVSCNGQMTEKSTNTYLCSRWLPSLCVPTLHQTDTYVERPDT